MDAPEYGSVNYVLTTYGETAEYICNENFNHVGVFSRTCTADVGWSPSAPYCEFSCGTLTQPLNGIAQTNTGVVEIMLGDVVTYACNIGYVLSHSNSRECLLTGLSESEPSCNLVGRFFDDLVFVLFDYNFYLKFCKEDTETILHCHKITFSFDLSLISYRISTRLNLPLGIF